MQSDGVSTRKIISNEASTLIPPTLLSKHYYVSKCNSVVQHSLVKSHFKVEDSVVFSTSLWLVLGQVDFWE